MGAKKAKDEGKKGWDFAKNILLGSAMGLATGGAIVSFSAVVAGGNWWCNGNGFWWRFNKTSVCCWRISF